MKNTKTEQNKTKQNKTMQLEQFQILQKKRGKLYIPLQTHKYMTIHSPRNRHFNKKWRA
jgi:hypothetical protein